MSDLTAAERVAEFIEDARQIALAVWSSEDDDELRRAVRKIEGLLGSALKEIAFRTDATLDAARSEVNPDLRAALEAADALAKAWRDGVWRDAADYSAIEAPYEHYIAARAALEGASS